MIKVSVIVPIYNAEKYLKQCLDSVVNQTLKEIEIILIDDGSSDKSGQICKQYLRDERVTYYYKENEGLAAARRDGMSHAKGEYIGFVDSDDWLELDMYQRMYEKGHETDSDVVFCNCMENENGHRFTPEMPSGLYNREEIIEKVLPKTLAYITEKGDKRVVRWSNCLRLYKRQTLIDNNIVFDGRFRRSQDLQLTYESMLVAKRFYYLGEEYLCHNRVVGDSLSRGYTKNMWPLYVPLIERLYKDTENFKEADLMNQMHLRAFFFVVECIDNEFKPLCPNDKKTRIKKIKEIMNHPICNRYYGHIPTEKLNERLRGYYNIIHRKSPQELMSFVNRLERKQKFDAKFKRPIVHFITEGPIIGKVYKTIRK